MNLIGQRYGRLVVVELVSKGPAIWKCQCDCGNTTNVRASNLRHGGVTSCKCLFRELASKRLKTHGMRNSPEYNVWTSMRKRCHNPRHKSYQYYGARGITVCDRWIHSFENFYSDMGKRPPGGEIERKDNDKPYCKENCIWSNDKAQARNRRSNVMTPEMADAAWRMKSEKISVTNIALTLGVSRGAISNVFYNGGWK